MNIAPQAGRLNKSKRESVANPPTPGIDIFLRRYVLRRRLLSLLISTGVAVTFFLAAVFVAVLLDRLIAFPRLVRLSVLIVTSMIAIGIIAPRVAVFFWRFDKTQAAIAIENQIAVFDQRLTTVVSHTGGGLLIDQLRREVEALVVRRDSRPAISFKPVLLSWAGAIVILVLIAAVWPSQRLGMATLMSRLFHPTADLPPATATRLAHTTKVDHQPNRDVRVRVSLDPHDTRDNLGGTP